MIIFQLPAGHFQPINQVAFSVVDTQTGPAPGGDSPHPVVHVSGLTPAVPVNISAARPSIPVSRHVSARTPRHDYGPKAKSPNEPSPISGHPPGVITSTQAAPPHYVPRHRHRHQRAGPYRGASLAHVANLHK